MMMIHIVKCTTRECKEYLKQKSIRLPHAGQGVYLNGNLVCGECGCTVYTDKLSRIETTALDGILDRYNVAREKFDRKDEEIVALKEMHRRNDDQLMLQFGIPKGPIVAPELLAEAKMIAGVEEIDIAHRFFGDE